MSKVASTSTKHKKDKSKKQKSLASTTTIPDAGKNEGADQNWAFQPPPGVKPISTNEDNGEFDWDAVKEDEDVEVWVMRVPENVRPAFHLSHIRFDSDLFDSLNRLNQSTSKDYLLTSRILHLQEKENKKQLR